MQADAFLFERSSTVATPSSSSCPTYDRTLLSLRNRGADVRMVELEPDGIDVAALERMLIAGARPKLAHIIPNFQNPAGYTLSSPSASGCSSWRASTTSSSSRTTRMSSCASAASGCRRCSRCDPSRWSTPRRSRRRSRPGSASGTWSVRAGDRADRRSSRPTPTSHRTWSPRHRQPVRALGRDRPLDRDRQERSARARRRALPRRSARAPRGPLRRAPKAATSCGWSCRAAPTSTRCSTPPPSATSSSSRARTSCSRATSLSAPRLLGCDPGGDRGGRRAWLGTKRSPARSPV